MPELSGENGKIIKTLWKAMESEKLDPSVLHLLVSTVMKYLSTETHNEVPNDEQHVTKQVSPA